MATSFLKAFSNSVLTSSVFFPAYFDPFLHLFGALLLPNKKELLPNYYYPLINFVNIKMLVVVLIVIVLISSPKLHSAAFIQVPKLFDL